MWENLFVTVVFMGIKNVKRDFLFCQDFLLDRIKIDAVLLDV